MPQRRELMPLKSAIAILCAAAVLLLSPPGLQLEENFGLRLLFALRGERPAPDAVTIIALDEESSAMLSLPDLDQLERWPRSVYAKLIRILADNGVAVVAMDIAFLAAGDSADDIALANAMRAAGNVVILKMLDRVDPEAGAGPLTEWQLPPLDLFADNAAAVGAFTLPDHAIKKYTTLFPDTPEGTEAAMPLLALQIHYGAAHAKLPGLLDDIGEPVLAQQLREKHNAALSAARLRSALLQNSSLANALIETAGDSLTESERRQLKILLQAYRAPDPIYLNFYGPQRTIRTLSLSDVLRNSDAAEVNALRGHAVFIGLSERLHKQRDYFFTAYSNDRENRISGVEVAATLFANLRDNQVLHAAPTWIQLMLLFGWGGILFVTAQRLAATQWLLLTAAFTAAYAFLALWLFAHYALWLPICIPLAIATPALALLAIWHYYRDMARSERAVADALSLYVPADIVVAARTNRDRLLNEHRQIEAFCLLTDIVGFTALSEQHSPEYMHDLMNRYYSEIVAAIERQSGFVANIVGDGLLALWPNSDSSGIIRSDNMQKLATTVCRTALDIVDASDRMSKAGESLKTCIGIHFGPLSLGHLGAGQHFEYAPVGDTINTTARVESSNRQLNSRILISETVHEYLSGFEVLDHGKVTLKGKREALALYELLAEKKH